MVEWAKDKRPVWEKICAKYGGKPEAFDWGTWQFFEWSLGKSWTTVASNAKARRFGWKRIDNTYDAWIDTFKTLASAGVIPSQTALRSSEEDDGDTVQQVGNTPGLRPQDNGVGLRMNSSPVS